MIVCKIEMWPGGIEDHPRKREIGRVIIANVGGDNATGHYDVVMPKSAEYAKRPGVWKRGKVLNFPRTRLGPLDLLLRALVACIGNRNHLSSTDVARGDIYGRGFTEAPPTPEEQEATA